MKQDNENWETRNNTNEEKRIFACKVIYGTNSQNVNKSIQAYM